MVPIFLPLKLCPRTITHLECLVKGDIPLPLEVVPQISIGGDTLLVIGVGNPIGVEGMGEVEVESPIMGLMDPDMIIDRIT